LASLLSHAIAAVGIGTVFAQRPLPKRAWVAGALCSVLPDVDVIGFRFGIHYGDFWGHRGFTHSLLFAAIVATVAALALAGKSELSRARSCTYLFIATASHGLLDSMTNGGLGVAFFSPFYNARYFLPWRPILVSPISVTRFFSERGLAVLQSEVVWIWIPAALLAVLMLVVRRGIRQASETSAPGINA
jgi:inner membrane protein